MEKWENGEKDKDQDKKGREQKENSIRRFCRGNKGIQSTLHKSMPHKWIFIQVDFFGRARPLPIASNRG